jgi:hypothetical protein
VKSNDDLRQKRLSCSSLSYVKRRSSLAGLELWVHPYRILANREEQLGLSRCVRECHVIRRSEEAPWLQRWPSRTFEANG